MSMNTKTLLIVGGAAAAAFYFFGGAAQAAQPAAPAASGGTTDPNAQDYASQTGQQYANYGTGADYQSHNPNGLRHLQRFKKTHPLMWRQFQRQHHHNWRDQQGGGNYGNDNVNTDYFHYDPNQGDGYNDYSQYP